MPPSLLSRLVVFAPEGTPPLPCADFESSVAAFPSVLRSPDELACEIVWLLRPSFSSLLPNDGLVRLF